MKNLLIALLLVIINSSALFANPNKELFDKLATLSKTNDTEAMYYLGMMYNNGAGTKQSYEKAYQLFLKSVDNPLSAYKLGCYYAGQAGNAVPYDHEKALKYKLISAKAGYSYAQNDVAIIFFEQQDYKASLNWFIKSSKQGFADAQRALRDIYYSGIGIEKNYIYAYAYARLYDRQQYGHLTPETVRFLTELSQTMSQSDINQANNFVMDWSAERTPLTIKANNGINSAVAYVEEQK